MLQKNSISSVSVLAFVLALACTPHASAERVLMQVAFENVPGARELHEGNLNRGISITESELKSENVADSGPLLANLCGAYVMTRELREAKRACEAAVDAEASPTAVNNRGVFRVLTGDFEGARRDFARVRPDDVDAYIEEIKRMDARFMAQENLTLLDEVAMRVALADDDGPLPLDIPVEKL